MAMNFLTKLRRNLGMTDETRFAWAGLWRFTWLRFLNLARRGGFFRRAYLFLERNYFGHGKLLTNPAIVKVNVTYLCNLRCPLCPTGRRQQPSIGCRDLRLEDMEFILGRIGNVKSVGLFGWGESFLTRDIFNVIDFLKEKGLHISIDSNLNLKDKKIVQRIGESNIDYLSISLDGVDQESYEYYRHAGKFDLAFENMVSILKSPGRPKQMQWQYIVNKKNAHLVDKARSMAQEIGIPIVCIDIGMYNGTFQNSTLEVKKMWWTEDQFKRLDNPDAPVDKRPCAFLYDQPFIDADGKVFPCCFAPHVPKSLLDEGYQAEFGDLKKNTLTEIWNNDHYQMMRKRFFGKAHACSGVKPICLKCVVYLNAMAPKLVAKMPVFDGHDEESSTKRES